MFLETKVDDALVLIVGAGPSGLMMAHELLRFGISVYIVEKDVTPSPYSRAIVVQIRTLEIFSALSLFDNLAKKSLPFGGAEIYAENRPPIQLTLEKTAAFFEYPLVVDQPHTEEVLLNAVLARGGIIHRGVELIAFTQNGDGIVAELRNVDGKVLKKKFSYIVGADGAHSAVRKSMSNQFLGTTYDDAFILADADCVHSKSHDAVRLFFRKKRFFAMIPMLGKDHYRLISVRRGETKKKGPPPTIEEFQQLAKDVVPFPIEIKNETWVSRFFVQCRSASHYQEGRAFLVGDAAHIHSPAGGQGMNTGLQDAFNLAWKMAMVLKNIARADLLKSYHDERKPVGDFLIERTDRLFKFMVKSSLWARLLRRFILPRVAHTSRLRVRLAKIASQTAIRYEAGVICGATEHLSLPGLKIGARIPNLNLISHTLKKTDLHKLTTGPYFSILFFIPKNIDKKRALEVIAALEKLQGKNARGLQSLLIFNNDYDAEKTSMAVHYFVALEPSASWQFEEPSFVIVRPDHHLFCLGSIPEFEHARNALHRFL